MKRLSLILALCCALLASCAARHEQDAAPQSYSLYFLRANLKDAAGDGALQPVDSGIPIQSDADPVETAEALLSALLDGPESDLYESAIPKGTALNGVTKEEIEKVLQTLGFDTRIRGEVLDIGGFAKITDKIAELRTADL